jgi:hypothetical protein
MTPRCHLTPPHRTSPSIHGHCPTLASHLSPFIDAGPGRNVQPELRLIRRGKLRLVPLVELERWANENAESVFSRPRRA